MQKIGLAMGGGGAKGLAHIPMLEVFEEFGLRPHRVAGTSIGAIIGALYCAGVSPNTMRETITAYSLREGQGLAQIFKRRDLLKWFSYIDINWGGRTLLKADAFLADLAEVLTHNDFEQLITPLSVVAADFWAREQVVLKTGKLIDAVHASMALPGLFRPAMINEQVLIDGGAVNPVPFDLLDDCDHIIAINVMGTRTESAEMIPSMAEAVFNTFQIMQASILRHKIQHSPPDLLLTPDIVDIQMLEFYKADTVFRQAENAAELLRRHLHKWLTEECERCP
ncbi:MAG: patatin [Gammaproteobacteria bacterium]|nr:MAG: patatin [Gammaproteobacteria bacterium]